MEQCHVIDWRFRSEIKADRRCEKNKQRQSRLDQLGEIANNMTARWRKIRIFKRGRFHARTGSLRGAPDPAAAGRPSALCEIRQQIAEMLTPKDSMTAPRATCAVATSAALLLQIVQAPSVIWQIINATQRIESLFSALKPTASRERRIQNAITAMAIISARNRWTICNQIWDAVTSDKPRASRDALIFASAAAA